MFPVLVMYQTLLHLNYKSSVTFKQWNNFKNIFKKLIGIYFSVLGKVLIPFIKKKGKIISRSEINTKQKQTKTKNERNPWKIKQNVFTK